MRRSILILIAVVMLLSGCKVPRQPGDIGPAPPTPPPTFPHQPGWHTVIFGAMLLNSDGDPIPGRISVYADAVDTTGAHGTSAGVHLPIDREVDSGWEFQVQVSPEHPHPVIFGLRVIAIGLDHREQVYCYLRDELYAYYDQNWNRATGTNPRAPRTVNCATTITPAGSK
jgi:hypothetical protein